MINCNLRCWYGLDALLVAIITKLSILDFWQGSKYASALCNKTIIGQPILTSMSVIIRVDQTNGATGGVL